MAKSTALARLEETVRRLCLAYPEAYEDHPWGESAFKVKGKVFVFMGGDGTTFGLSTKLPISSSVALMLPFANPTGYGLGKSGWVSARLDPKDGLPLDLLTAWIDESYRAVAPKKLAATLPPLPGAPSPSARVNEPPSKVKAPPKKVKAPPKKVKAPASRPKTPTSRPKSPSSTLKAPPKKVKAPPKKVTRPRKPA